VYGRPFQHAPRRVIRCGRRLRKHLWLPAPYVLAGSIDRLEEVDQGREVHAVCAISAQLIDVRTKPSCGVVANRRLAPVVQRNVAGVVSGLSAAATTAVDRLVTSVETALTAMHTP
jgi:hypothetical protein